MRGDLAGIRTADPLLHMPNCPFVLFSGSKKLVKRKEFEDYIGQKVII
ncbi:excisionase [uncultured Oscillibacter sp.]|nr:excisionase [uncultured Oscillibacter sp.]